MGENDDSKYDMKERVANLEWSRQRGILEDEDRKKKENEIPVFTKEELEDKVKDLEIKNNQLFTTSYTNYEKLSECKNELKNCNNDRKYLQDKISVLTAKCNGIKKDGANAPELPPKQEKVCTGNSCTPRSFF